MLCTLWFLLLSCIVSFSHCAQYACTHPSLSPSTHVTRVQIDRRLVDYIVGLDTELNELVEGSELFQPTGTCVCVCVCMFVYVCMCVCVCVCVCVCIYIYIHSKFTRGCMSE